MTQYDADREATLKRAFDADIGVICVGVDLASSKQAIEMAAHYDNVWASVGLHPNESVDFDTETYRLLALDPKVVAIGEVGLDYYLTTDPSMQKAQKMRFEKQITLAIETKKPLIIHCRSAHKDMIDLLFHPRYKLFSKGVIHSFTGTWNDARHYLELGFYIGLNGIITFTDQYNETISNTPLDRILLETDAPYLSPEPHRGKRNEPSYVTYVANQIAKIKNISVDEVAHFTTENAKRLFAFNQ